MDYLERCKQIISTNFSYATTNFDVDEGRSVEISGDEDVTIKEDEGDSSFFVVSLVNTGLATDRFGVIDKLTAAISPAVLHDLKVKRQ